MFVFVVNFSSNPPGLFAFLCVPPPAPKVLTSLPRQEWASAKARLATFSPKNAENLLVIDSALFVVALDDDKPREDTSVSDSYGTNSDQDGHRPIDDIAANMLHGSYRLNKEDVQIGTCCNRWYDKLMLIVMPGGTAGVNFEHSAIDGHTALRFV